MAETYTLISVIAFSLSAVFLIWAAFFWFRYQIPKVIGDLSGKTAQKAIAQIKTGTGSPGNQTSAPNIYTARETAERQGVSGHLVQENQRKTKKTETKQTGRRAETSRLFEVKTKGGSAKGAYRPYYTEPVAQQAARQTAVLEPPQQEAEQTGLLDDYTGSERTEVLWDKTLIPDEPLNQTEILPGFSQTTVLLNGGRQTDGVLPEATQLLETQLPPENDMPRQKPALFNVMEAIVMVHTEEVIS